MSVGSVISAADVCAIVNSSMLRLFVCYKKNQSWILKHYFMWDHFQTYHHVSFFLSPALSLFYPLIHTCKHAHTHTLFFSLFHTHRHTLTSQSGLYLEQDLFFPRIFYPPLLSILSQDLAPAQSWTCLPSWELKKSVTVSVLVHSWSLFSDALCFSMDQGARLC